MSERQRANVSVRPVGPADRLLCSWCTDHGERFLVLGVVRWVRDEGAASEDAPAGCGVKWVHLEDGALEAIHHFIDVRQTDFYED